MKYFVYIMETTIIVGTKFEFHGTIANAQGAVFNNFAYDTTLL
jgi:hypothetical protein